VGGDIRSEDLVLSQLVFGNGGSVGMYSSMRRLAHESEGGFETVFLLSFLTGSGFIDIRVIASCRYPCTSKPLATIIKLFVYIGKRTFLFLFLTRIIIIEHQFPNPPSLLLAVIVSE